MQQTCIDSSKHNMAPADSLVIKMLKGTQGVSDNIVAKCLTANYTWVLKGCGWIPASNATQN